MMSRFHTLVLVLAVLLPVPSAIEAQSDDPTLAAAEAIERAVAQSPLQFNGEATLIRWTPDHDYEVLRDGTNTLVCYDRSDERGRAPFAAQCTHEANLERVAQNRRFRAETEDTAGENGRIAEAEADGTRVEPEYGSMWFRMDGPDAERALLHATIAIPGATMESTGLPESGDAGGAWIMDAGTSAAHVMIPGR